jgi:Ca2+-binding EF-hand superfamily protein
VVKEFRKLVSAHGGSNGIRTLGAIFRRMDDNGNRHLSAQELQSGIQDYGVRMSLQDCQVLLAAMDRSGRGSLSFDDFLLAMRGKMNAFRLGFVEKAFTIVDRNGNGIVDMSDLKAAYDPSRNPDVMQGQKTADQALREFMAVWENDSSVDGKVTKEEFIDYYQDVSASIDRDDYFELMIRNAWHMSGGSGASENTSNIRVLVIFTDGSQQVVELKDDIGVSRTDARAIRTRLRKQGLSNIAKIRLS